MAASGLTVAEFLEYLAPGLWTECPRWPGVLFALVAAVLEKSSAYAALGTGGWPCRGDGGTFDWQERIETLADQCRLNIAQSLASQSPELPPPPQSMVDHWGMLVSVPDRPIAALRHDKRLVKALVELLAFSDECLAGAGIVNFDAPAQESDEAFWWKAEELLLPGSSHEAESSLCWRIHPSRLRVLPKSQTPRSGLSLRSLSHHLALCPPIEVAASWRTEACLQELDDDCCNILLIPWPFTIEPKQFSPVPIPPEEEGYCPEDTGWFRYSPVQLGIGELTQRVETLIQQAPNDVGRVDLVVFPELALTQEQFEGLKPVAARGQFGLITGVLHNAQEGRLWPGNTVHVQLPTERAVHQQPREVMNYVQSKHHRWRLSEDQIVRYGLSSRLHPSMV